MIFVGDVAIAEGDSFTQSGFPPEFANKPLCVNLEGAVPSSSRGGHASKGVANEESWIRSFRGFRLGPVFLANNHVQDVPGGIASTVKHLRSVGLEWFGAGDCQQSASAAVSCVSDNINYSLVGAGWPVIGCKPAKGLRDGVCGLDGEWLKESVRSILKLSPDSRVVVVLHWNYEFERFPQPGHRKLALDLIDSGAYAVVGHHPHIAGPVERYKDRTIAYSLGNWAFSYGRHFDGRLRFPEASFQQLAVELGANEDVLHYAHFEPPSRIKYERAQSINDPALLSRASFEGASDVEYAEWFKKNRVKKKALPIYYDYRSSLSNSLRDHFVAGRQLLIDSAVRVGLKSLRRSVGNSGHEQ